MPFHAGRTHGKVSKNAVIHGMLGLFWSRAYVAIMGRSKIVYFFVGLIRGGKNSENFVQNDNCIENFDCCSTAKTRGLCFSALKRKLPLFTICFASMFYKTCISIV